MTPDSEPSDINVRIVRDMFAEAAERAARWWPAACPELQEAADRLAAMERPK